MSHIGPTERTNAEKQDFRDVHTGNDDRNGRIGNSAMYCRILYCSLDGVFIAAAGVD